MHFWNFEDRCATPWRVTTRKFWLTCCALHNWLLEVDGLDVHWENGVASEWEGKLGRHSAKDSLMLAS
jgi:hypothetical protein